MNRERRRQALSFGGAAAAMGAAALVARAVCPGGCTACASCAQTAVPALVSGVAVVGAISASALGRRRAEGPADGEAIADVDGHDSAT